ncbi:MAG TPA: GAF domain-containing sensor histidine kinase [Egibacteraceae bacterium]
MTTASRTDSRAESALNDAVLAIAAEHSPGPVLRRLVRAARELVDARYAAIGVPDGAGGFASFLTDGMSDELKVAIGPLPRTHGLLGAMLNERQSYRSDDIRSDPRFQGWPPAHPEMRSFLGVPIISAGEVLGAFYLTEKIGAPRFSDADQELIERFAAHAALAIDRARLFARSRELVLLEERTRLARDLHDAMTQTLFSLSLTAQTALSAYEEDPASAGEHVRRVAELSRDALAELRSLVSQLRPADLEADGLVAALRERVDVLRRSQPVPITLSVDCVERLPADHERELFRIASEALGNALTHARPSHVEVSLATGDDRATLAVRDDGVGFDPDDPRLRATRLGLASMRARASALGGSLTIDSAPGKGTTVVASVPLKAPDG